ncbi:MAG TPA: hypothetical protein VIR01_18305 [Pyrinomonadaceae bacterium]
MPVQFSKSAVIEKNRIAIEACDLSIDRLEELGEKGLFADAEAERLVLVTRATNTRTNLKQINAHLRAAGTVMRPMADNVAKELNDLGNRLDQQIRNDLILNAKIGFITSVLSDVNKLRAIINAHRA